ncbi:hypothetical protein D5S18_27630 [Nocardia panacis]|uniref:Serine hydrolase n=1 Tax=Nocardia panacis TaxID=2340916 RepID=A0A3A4JPJ7_9NOCA|nr:hypothetical protein [Nocardia panacis]RJO70948.1 hypothetical protein D5S18_27630 [Nocardia panacis]
MTGAAAGIATVLWLGSTTAAALWLGAGSAAAEAHRPSGAVADAAVAVAVPEIPQPATEVAEQMQSAIRAASPDSRVGIDVVDLDSGAVLAGLDVDHPFFTASVVKLLIALDALKSADWQPDPAAAAQLRQMLAASDDGIADGLWDANGGPEIVSRMIEMIGLPGTLPPEDRYQWGETLTTPRDVVSIYRYIAADAPPQARDLLLGALHGADKIAADGTDQYFGIPAGLPGVTWAVKQGWMSLDSSTTIDTTGLIGLTPDKPYRYAVVVLTTQPADTAWAAAGSAVTAGIGVLGTIIQHR